MHEVSVTEFVSAVEVSVNGISGDLQRMREALRAQAGVLHGPRSAPGSHYSPLLSVGCRKSRKTLREIPFWPLERPWGVRAARNLATCQVRKFLAARVLLRWWTWRSWRLSGGGTRKPYGADSFLKQPELDEIRFMCLPPMFTCLFKGNP